MTCVSLLSLFSVPFETHRLVLLSEEEWKSLTEFYQCDHEICVQRDPGDEKVITTRPRKYYLIGHLHVSLSLSLSDEDMQSGIHKKIPRLIHPVNPGRKKQKERNHSFCFSFDFLLPFSFHLGVPFFSRTFSSLRVDDSPLSVLLLQIWIGCTIERTHLSTRTHLCSKTSWTPWRRQCHEEGKRKWKRWWLYPRRSFSRIFIIIRHFFQQRRKEGEGLWKRHAFCCRK